MSNDFSPINTPESESPMFAGTPSWERGKKRRGFGSRGSRVAAEPRSFGPEFAPEPGDPLPMRPATVSEDTRAHEARMDAVDPTDTNFSAGPTFADRTRRKGNGAAPILVAAGINLVGGLAAAGWYATQKGVGIAELTPGAPATTTTTRVASTAPATGEPPAPAAEAAAPQPAAPAATHSVTSTTTRTPPGAVTHSKVTTHARPAADAAADASATAPIRATPTPAAPPTAAAPPAPLVLTIPPTQAAPPAPAETPAPPATQTPPTQTPPSR
jgi:hypothetical protein